MKRTMFSNSERRLQRQMEALARQEERANRTDEEQLTILTNRGVFSGREFDRLTAKVKAKMVEEEAEVRKQRAKKYKKVKA